MPNIGMTAICADKSRTHDSAEDQHILAFVTGHVHDDAGRTGGGVEQKAEGQDDQDQGAARIGLAEQRQDEIAEKHIEREDAEREQEAGPGAEGRDRLRLAHVAGMVVFAPPSGR